MTHFTDYRDYCRHLITTRRRDYLLGDSATQQAILHANLPFEYKPPTATKQAVLLIHGLYDSPCMMHSLSAVFIHENYLVRSILLPGHGTCPEDLLLVTYQDWLSACRVAIELLPTTIERIVIAGFSTGALISHYLALQNEIPRLAGLVAIAPALQLHRLERLLLNNRFIIQIAKKLSPWTCQTKVYDYAKYSQHALNGAVQVQRLIQQCPDRVCSLPVFWVLSASDSVIDSKALWQRFQTNQANPQSRCFIYSSTPLTFANDPRIIVRSSYYPEQSIINFSHICLTVAPDHPHYGCTGDYTLNSNASAKRPLILGERGGKSTARLTYNPDFTYMAHAIQKFLKNL